MLLEGPAETMVSDNAAIFSTCAINLKELCNKESVVNHLSTLNINWKFIPSRAPSFGGVGKVNRNYENYYTENAR